MQSLRSRRPSESSPKSQQRGNKLIRPSQRDLARKTTRVDDKIRKRMSMRYADISSPTSVDGVPPVPSLPIGTSLPMPGHGEEDGVIVSATTPAEDSRVVELRLLDNDEFDADAFLKLKLANSTEAELKTLQSSLQSQKQAVAVDLQHDVFKNYEEFVQVSKEVSVLENEMLEFKECLADWKSMPSLLHIEESASVADRRRNVRSSVADLRVLYANQMQTLHTQIEGSNKFVPTTAGRHVITELDNVLSLNPATYKVDHTTRFVVLDDAVLVARRRRRRNNAESDKLVAERCWPLNEMLVLDTKDTATMSNVFKIRHGKETHVYRTEAPGDKRHLLQQFRQVAEELSAKRRKEREGEHLRRKSLWGGDRNSVAFDAAPSPPPWMAEMMAQEMGSTAKEKAERDARWISDFSDDLTVAISLREWDQAVSLVEQGEANLPTMPSLAVKLNPLKASLTAALLQSLSMPTNRKTMVVSIISLLVRLKAGAAARNTFLAVRADLLRKRVRMIRFEGHIPLYISDLAIVVFTGIKHTADWFLASFRENEVASCFVEWARKQMEVYAEMFRKQVYSTDVDQETIEEAIKITHIQSRKLLEEYGIDFRFLLDRILIEKPKDTLPPPTFRSHPEKEPERTRVRASTPLRARSPAYPSVPPLRSPVPPVPPLPEIAPLSHTPRIVSPTPRAASAVSTRSATPTPRTRGSAAPPPRSRDRPGSATGHRPPPVAIPRREGMI
ncbi:Exocyst complex component EXO84 [Sparassis crispa]|uniref:Exocyst complex component EXO84 n=1 Tax=Sparassis crispa TaxID=139825 RepID=A0A401G4Y0_9APHY|nr:Exocyst complex component EXO84 [Sparassis crispa]GBE77202.1 Exocyst complex component EXO84 [Sparassis crispa]